MAILKQNSSPVPACSAPELSNQQSSSVETDLADIRADLARSREKVQSFSDVQIQNISEATSFFLVDIEELLATTQTPKKYLRVYNGLNAGGEYVTYIALVKDDSDVCNGDDTVVIKYCCKCSPCLTDRLLYSQE